tara:strand:- start:122 stop:403 length:282 start_codon:yes stop_codon:yes gene_type:complete
MSYRMSKYLCFIRFSNEYGHFLFFIKIFFKYLYVSSFPTVNEKRFLFCDYLIYKSIINKWSKNPIKPDMVSFPESRDIRKSLFKKFVKKPNEK